MPRKRFWERVRDKDFGPQELGLNLLGIAVSGDILYGSLFLENKVVAVNWRTGERLKEFSLPRPCGIAVNRDGQLIVVSDKRLVLLNPQTGAVTPLVTEGLSSPWGVALDNEGNIFVTDCGDSMQVKVFKFETGKGAQLIRTIGKKGGRPWVGRYDPEGMLRPSGITVDGEGKVWVCEHDDAPRRISVWTKDGNSSPICWERVITP
jgi:NHL repeat.